MNRRQEVQSKIDEYRGFLEATLRPQLEQARVAKRVVQDEQDEYQTLLQELRRLSSSSSSPSTSSSSSSEEAIDTTTRTVDLGWNKVYCEAEIVLEKTANTEPQDNNKTQPKSNEENNEKLVLLVAVDVGMGFHVQLTTSEAMAFCQRRLQFLQTKYNHRQATLRKVQEHVTTAEDILDHLSNEVLSMR